MWGVSNVGSGFSRIAWICQLFILLAAAPAAAQPAPALRIVVIEGEDAVNVIQQKTAVRPVVEVRDRNDLPVSGVLVTFSIEGAKGATFGGASTLTVATNAAGQAAVTGLTPTAAGALQINVSAAVQGQIATATITQTNVMTVAQAAAASAAGGGGTAGGGGAGSGAGAGGGAAGGSGGLSATTIGIAGAAVAGGAVAATQLTKDDEPGENKFTGSFSGQVISESVGGGGNVRCTVTRSVNADVTLRLDVNTASSVSGVVEFAGTDAVVSQTCTGPTRSDRFTIPLNVTGTPAAFGARDTRTSTAPVEQDPRLTRQQTTELVFEASLSGDTVTATLKFNEQSVTTGGDGGVVNEKAAGTFPMTLRRVQ